MTMRLRGQALLVVGIPLLVMLLALAGIAQLEREPGLAMTRTEHSDQRLFRSELLLLRLVDAETGVRGYAATRDRRFLEPYTNALRMLPALISRLRAAGERVPPEISAQAVPVAREAVEQIALLKGIRRSLDDRSPVVVSELLLGKLSMDAIRRSIERMQATERAVNGVRRARATHDGQVLSYAIAGAFLLAIFGAIAAIVAFTNRVIGRLTMVIGKTERVAADQELGPPIGGTDEVAALDRAVHRMAVAIHSRNDAVEFANSVLDERNRELIAANSELERFTYSVSHDLRAPVRAIDSFSHRLDQDHAGQLDPEGRRLLAVVYSEATRMGFLIDDLLEFSRLGRQQIKMGAVDMTALANDVADLAKSVAMTEIRVTVAPLPDARGDRALLRQVWDNLISNAIKYSSAQTQSIVSVSGSVNDRFVTYQVSDNGVGFEMKYAHKLFNVFERLHRADEFPGTGVGLAIVKRIVERHGGRVWATAEPGAGATFSFSLPWNESN